MKLENNNSINLYNNVNFVALKNGKHDQKGYITSFGEFQNFMPPENSHVKELFNSIINYFDKK